MADWYTTAQVAEQLGVNPSRVRALAADRGVGSRTGRDWLFRADEIEALRHRRAGRPPRHLGPTPSTSLRQAMRDGCAELQIDHTELGIPLMLPIGGEGGGSWKPELIELLRQEVDDDTAPIYLWITRNGRIYTTGGTGKRRRYAYLLIPG